MRVNRELVISSNCGQVEMRRETNFEPGSCCQPIYQTQSLGAALETAALAHWSDGSQLGP